MLSLIAFVALTLCAVGSYLVWPNRWNIPAHLQAGFVFVAYVVPLLILDVLADFDESLVTLYVTITTAGAVFFVAGLFLGFYGAPRFNSNRFAIWTHHINFNKLVRRKALLLACFSVVVILLCFAVMGFIPAFSDDPFSAKFFKGGYQDSYRPVAIPYQVARQWVVLLVPVLLVLWYYGRSRAALVVAGIGTIVYFLQLTRGGAITGFLIFAAIPFVRMGRLGIILYLFATTCIYALGSAAWVVLGIWTGADESIWTGIAAGAPDVLDHLQFLAAFTATEPFALGRTVLGGLIPYQFEWNPGIWTLAVMNESSDVSEIASGGLRLPIGLWGYANFGWLGVLGFPLISGSIVGFLTWQLKLRMIAAHYEPLYVVIALQIYFVWSGFLGGLTLSIYSLPAIAGLYYLSHVGMQRSRTNKT